MDLLLRDKGSLILVFLQPCLRIHCILLSIHKYRARALSLCESWIRGKGRAKEKKAIVDEGVKRNNSRIGLATRQTADSGDEPEI